MKSFFLDADGKLRFMWRAIIFAILAALAAPPLLQVLLGPVQERLRIKDALSPDSIAWGEAVNFLIAFVCTLPLARYERRSPFSYGFPLSKILGARTWEGFFVGIVMAGAVGIGMIALGGMQVHSFALTGNALLYAGLAWLGANVLVGLSEEYFFRSYFLQTLWKSIGFWPASIVIALIFAAAHYFLKPGENIWDVITLVTLSVWLCYTVLRTGNLWFAVGFHIAFDFMQFFVIGTENGMRIPEDRMFNVTFDGPVWLTGGVLGTEASFLMYPLILLIWLYVWLRFRGRPNFNPASL